MFEIFNFSKDIDLDSAPSKNKNEIIDINFDDDFEKNFETQNSKIY